MKTANYAALVAHCIGLMAGLDFDQQGHKSGAGSNCSDRDRIVAGTGIESEATGLWALTTEPNVDILAVLSRDLIRLHKFCGSATRA